MESNKAKILRQETTARGHCLRCLMQDFDEETYVTKLLRVIRMMKPSERAAEEVTRQRLDTCLACDKLERGTCMACGCYVELRASMRGGRCPYRKWK